MIQYFSSQQSNLVALDALPKTDTPLWINVEAPSDEDIQILMKACNKSRGFFNAVLDDAENSRVSGYNDDKADPLTILLKYPKYTTSPLGYIEYSTYPIQFILYDNTIISISNQPAAFIQHFVMNQEKLGSVIKDHELFLSQIMWFISHDYVSALNDTTQKMTRMERKLTTATENQQIYQIMALQKTLIEFQNSLTQNRKVLNQIHSGTLYFDSSRLSDLNSGAIIENEQALTMANKQSQILDQYSNMISSVISNNLNDVMKILTSITIILTVPTIIGGLYGMNVTLPGATIANAFTWICLITLVICLITMYILKHHKYM